MFNLLKRLKVGYVIRYTRVLQPSGEQFEVTCNLPPKAKAKDFENAFTVMGSFPEARMRRINEAVMKSDKNEQVDTPLNRDQRRKLENSAKKPN
jgi:hypothetical protein